MARKSDNAICAKCGVGFVDDSEYRSSDGRLCSECRNLPISELLDAVPFSLECANGECNFEGPDTYREAVDQGWTEIEYDDGPSWNFLGFCAECSKEHEKSQK